ncbi:CBU_0592 family membrane protein [Niabella insulamsoli]|uniref:CBU_0592 family membrane protein n=1 Tax=Niabella insulamsoli TaxID=3144874 RepID=UPI0031FBFFFB
MPYHQTLTLPLGILFISEQVSFLVGWIGTAFYLIAYLLISFNKVKANKPAYHLLNMAGAAGLIIHALYMKDGPNLICNLAWLSIAVIAVISIRWKRTK